MDCYIIPKRRTLTSAGVGLCVSQLLLFYVFQQSEKEDLRRASLRTPSSEAHLRFLFLIRKKTKKPGAGPGFFRFQFSILDQIIFSESFTPPRMWKCTCLTV